jgi:hypothetical protein
VTRESAPKGASQIAAAKRDRSQHSVRAEILEYLEPSVSLGDMRARDMTVEQLSHYTANRRAMENAGSPPPLEYEQRERSVAERLYETAEAFRLWCDDEDMLAADLAWKVISKLGFTTEETEEVLRSVGITWSAEKPAA